MKSRGLLLDELGQCCWMKYDDFLTANRLNPHQLFFCALTDDVGICFDIESNRQNLMSVVDLTPDYLPFLKGPVFLLGMDEHIESGELEPKDLSFQSLTPLCNTISKFWHQRVDMNIILDIAEGLRPPLVLI